MAPKRNRDQSDRDAEELRRIAQRGILRNNIARTIQTLNEDNTNPYGLPNAWRPIVPYAPAGNPAVIVPAPNAPALQGNFVANAPAGNLAQPANPQFQDVNLGAINVAPEEDGGVEEEGIDEDEEIPRVDINYQQATANDRIQQDPFAELGDVDLSEFDDFGTGRLFGNGVSGRRIMNHRRRMYY